MTSNYHLKDPSGNNIGESGVRIGKKPQITNLSLTIDGCLREIKLDTETLDFLSHLPSTDEVESFFQKSLSMQIMIERNRP